MGVRKNELKENTDLQISCRSECIAAAYTMGGKKQIKYYRLIKWTKNWK